MLIGARQIRLKRRWGIEVDDTAVAAALACDVGHRVGDVLRRHPRVAAV
jgi:hypothetical protein